METNNPTINKKALINVKDIENELKMTHEQSREKSLNANLEAEYSKRAEEEHKKLFPRLTDRQWLEIFPEAEGYLISKLAKLQTEQKKLKVEIRKNLLKIYKAVKDEFAIWFNEKIVEVWQGERLNQTGKEIRKIKWMLSPEESADKTNKITDYMIQRAKNYPFEHLIKFNQAKKALCIFHSEKRPSMSLNLKTNRIKCFACGINFDPIGYVMEMQNISFISAVKYLNN